MAPARGWNRALGNTRSFVGNALGGVRGWSNLASWVVAGSLAYYLWVKPARELQKEQEVSTRLPLITYFLLPIAVLDGVPIRLVFGVRRNWPQITDEDGRLLLSSIYSWLLISYSLAIV
jgi:hypothetical protein